MTTIYNAQNKMTERAERFDQCYVELSPEAKAWLDMAIKTLTEQMANGGGTKSAKELLYQLAKNTNGK